MPKTAGIITCVTNTSGYGPGHTALYINGTCYSFEQMGNKNGWLVLRVDEYVDKPSNRGRPLIYYQLNERVNPDQIEDWLIADAKGWSLYGPNVCSQRASHAVNAGTPGGFDPPGYDTPLGVYWHAWEQRLVGDWWAVWKEPGLQNPAAQARIYAKLKKNYEIEPGDMYIG
jgi:hypothetical protein